MAINYTAAAEKAKKYLQKNQVDRAIALWTDFLPNAPDNDTANVLNNLGDLCARKKNAVEATDHYLKASQAFENAGFPLKAIATLKKVLKLDPDRTEVYLRLGDLNARRDMIGNAVESYLQVARLLVAEGAREEALAMVQKICILDPVNTRHRLQLAAELFELGFPDQAIDETVNAVDLFLEGGNLEEAERYCRHLLDLQPGCAAAQERLERIARWGTDRPAQGTAVDSQDSIDALFAELDGAAEPAAEPAVAPTPEAELSPEPEAEAAPEAPAGDDFTLDLAPPDAGPDLELTAPEPEEVAAQAEADLRDLLEPTSQSFQDLVDAEAGAATEVFGEIPLDEVDSPDTDGDTAGETAEATTGDPTALEREATEHLEAGRLPEALELLGQVADAHLAGGDPAAADAALAHYLSLDPDNPRAWEIRLRVVEGRDPEAERATLEHLAGLLSDTDPARAEEVRQRARTLAESASAAPADEAAVPDTEAAGSADFMSISLDETAPLAASEEAVEAVEAAGEADADEAGDAGGAWTLDLAAVEGPEGLSEDTTEASDEAPDPDLDAASLDLSGAYRADETELDPGTLDLRGQPDEAQAAPADQMPGLEVGGPGQAETQAETPADAAPEPEAEPAAPKAPAASHGFDLKEALTEGRFYERQELTAEAIGVYRDILAHDPGNADAIARLNALGAPVEGSAPAPAADAAPATPEPAPAAPKAEAGGGDEFLEFTEAIEDTIEKEVSGSWRNVGEEAQFDEILQAFRKGIQAEVSDDDAETHYDLGLAYHEMGLTEEAVGEFQLAIKGATRFADATIMLARCFSELGKERLAATRLKEAVGRSGCGEAEWISLAYELATVLDGMGERDEARQMYEEVYARDITYRDVAKRLAGLN